MKTKTILTAAVVSCVLSGCMSAGSSTSSNKNNNSTAALLGAAATAATGNSSSLAQTGAGVLSTLLSSLLGNATTNKQTIVGKWTYQGPEVRFESENILSQIGGTVVSNKIQTALGTQLSKIGLTAGKSTFTFNSDGTMKVTMGSKTTNGTYTFDQRSNTITMKGALGLANLTATIAVTGNTMYLLFDSSKLLSMATQLSSTTSATSALSSLLGNYSGMKLGWSMKK